MAEVTMKNTKEQIFAALQEAQKQLQALKAQKFDPQAAVTQKKTADLLENVANLTPGGIEETVTSMKKSLNGVLDFLTNNTIEQLKQYNDVKEAIKVQEAKLKELLDIEAEALSLVAIVNAKQELANKFDADFAVKKAEAEKVLADIQQQAKEAREALAKQVAEEKARIEKERQREQEEYEYNFNRRKQQANDALADELNAKRKTFAMEVEQTRAVLQEKEEELDKREEAISKREEKMEELEAKVAEIPSLIESAKRDTTAEVTARLTQEFEREKAFLKKEHEFQISNLENKIKLLEEALDKANAANADMAKKLDAAYTEIKDMAVKSVQASGDSKVVESLQRVIAEGKNNLK